VISETIKQQPNTQVVSWLKSVPNHHLGISALTLGEIRKGAEKLTDSRNKTKIVQWLEIDLVEWFANRIVTIDARVADKWGYLCAENPRSLPAVDCLLAASALSHGLTLVTRNSKDFEMIKGLELLNPWL